MGLIRGITVELSVKHQAGIDGLGIPVYKTAWERVGNVLVTPLSNEEHTELYNLLGRYASYTLSIPKGDKHTWIGCEVRFWGHLWRVIGAEKQYIEALVPLDWNKKVVVECAD